MYASTTNYSCLVALLTGLVKPTNMVCSCHHPESKNLEAMSVSSI